MLAPARSPAHRPAGQFSRLGSAARPTPGGWAAPSAAWLRVVRNGPRAAAPRDLPRLICGYPPGYPSAYLVHASCPYIPACHPIPVPGNLFQIIA